MTGKKSKKVSYHKRIVNLLSDGAWHSLRDIHQAVARYIPSEAADKEYQKRHPAWEEVKEAVRVAQGKKRLVLLSMLSLVHHRKLVLIGKGHDWERQYRMKKKALPPKKALPTKPEPEAAETPKEATP